MRGMWRRRDVLCLGPRADTHSPPDQPAHRPPCGAGALLSGPAETGSRRQKPRQARASMARLQADPTRRKPSAATARRSRRGAARRPKPDAPVSTSRQHAAALEGVDPRPAGRAERRVVRCRRPRARAKPAFGRWRRRRTRRDGGRPRGRRRASGVAAAARAAAAEGGRRRLPAPARRAPQRVPSSSSRRRCRARSRCRRASG